MGTVADSFEKVAGTTIDIVRKARELKNQGLSNETAEKILRESGQSPRWVLKQVLDLIILNDKSYIKKFLHYSVC